MDSNLHPNQPTDSHLIEQACEGNREAFDELVKRYHAPLVSFLKFVCSHRIEVDDVAQEAFLKSYVNLHQFDTNRSFKNWLYTIARRSVSKKRLKAAPTDPSIEQLTDNAADPGCQVEQDDQNRNIWETVRKYSSDQEFQIMWFRYAEQMTIREIASVMQKTEASLKMNLSRIRKRLRPHLSRFADPRQAEPATDPNDDLFDEKKKKAA